MMNTAVRRGIWCVFLGCLMLSQWGQAKPSTTKKTIEWPKTIAWQSFEAGQMQAAESKKPMLILVYANWCQQCERLAAALACPDFVKAAKDFVMVLTNHDDPSQGTHHYTPELSYVPRLLFMKPDGEFWSELTSGNPRYSYYYQPAELEVLFRNMAKSLATHRGK